MRKARKAKRAIKETKVFELVVEQMPPGTAVLDQVPSARENR